MLQGVPAVSHEEPRLLAACAQAGPPRTDDLEVEASEAQTDPRTWTPEVHDKKRASAPQHAEVLGEHGPEVRDVAKRVSHGREVEVLVAERQRLRHALAEADPRLLVRLGEHPRAGVDAHDGTPRPHDGHGGAGERTGPHGDVEDLHPFREPGAPQCVAAGPCAPGPRPWNPCANPM